MKIFEVTTKFIFTGKFIVKAENGQKAARIVKENCGLVMGGNIHTNCNDEDIDWDFDMHPEKKTTRIRMVKRCATGQPGNEYSN